MHSALLSIEEQLAQSSLNSALFDLGLGDELVVTVERLAAEELGETNPNPVGPTPPWKRDFQS